MGTAPAPRYVAITGGIGGAKLGLGLAQVLRDDELTFLVNTGDDFDHLGLHISPDVDTLIYTLAGLSNTDAGWGRAGETWQFMDAIGELGGETWFRLGDKDLATHVQRTQRLAAGADLTTVTNEIAEALGVVHRILPMSNEAVRTVVQTNSGDLDFQHYFVRDRCAPTVHGVIFRGADTAKISPELRGALTDPALAGVIVCPSNPYLSIDPILAVPGIRATLEALAVPVVAVSPIVAGAAIKGPTAKLMAELDVPSTAIEIARYYAGWVDGLVLDTSDAALTGDVRALGMASVATPTVMVSLDDRVALARDVLRFIQDLSS